MSAPLMPVEQALECLLQLAEQAPDLASQWCDLGSAYGRVLAEPVQADLDLPPWPNSAMDGYALRAADYHGAPMVVSQRIFAGQMPQPLAAGSCARIFTGAPVPEGADTVIMQEEAEAHADGCVSFTAPVRAGANIRPQGQEARAGDCMLSRGTRLGAIELALAASVGAARVNVYRPLKVAVLSTGDELVEPGQSLAPGQIYNSNRRLLISWLTRLGCEAVDAGILPDDLVQTQAALAKLSEVDVILSTGGVSVGEADYLGMALRDGGEIALWKLAIKPGKPLTVGHYAGTAVLGLPGNPASTLVTFGLLARPYLLRRMRAAETEPLSMLLPAGFAWPKAGGRREYLRARIEQGQVVLYSNQSSGVLRSAAWAQGLVEVPEGRAFEVGEMLRFIPMSELFA